MLERMDQEEPVDGLRMVPRPPPTPKSSHAPPREAVRAGGALVRTYDNSDDDDGDPGAATRESEELIESTRAMFSTLLDGHSTIMQKHTAIESEITAFGPGVRGLHQTAQDLQTRVEALEDEMQQMQARAAARERELEEKLATASERSRQTGDADELARRIEEQLERAAAIHTVLADAESASVAQRSSVAAALQIAQQECKELHKQVHAAKERAHKLAKALESEKDKSRSLSANLADAEEQNKQLVRQLRGLEMELQTKSEELDLMFKTSEAQRREQRKAAEAEQEKRGELEDKVCNQERVGLQLLHETRRWEASCSEMIVTSGWRPARQDRHAAGKSREVTLIASIAHVVGPACAPSQMVYCVSECLQLRMRTGFLVLWSIHLCTHAAAVT